MPCAPSSRRARRWRPGDVEGLRFARRQGLLTARQPIAPLEYSRRVWLRLTFLATLVFLYAPIAILVVFSFNDSRRNIVWRGFTLKYYEKAYNDTELFDAFVNSLTIAFVNTIFAVILGAMVAVALWRFRFPGKPAYEGAMALPIVIPEICMGVAMLAFLLAHRLAGQPALAAQPGEHHHRPCRLFLPLRGHGRARPPDHLQP